MSNPPPHTLNQSRPAPSADGGIRILLVEDEKKLARSIERQLQRAGFQVELAFDGESALLKAVGQAFHLIILDVNLPHKSGFDVLRELRSQFYETPVIILTARDATPDKIFGLAEGADDYVTKPFDSGELVARIQAILRRSGISRASVIEAADLKMDVVKRTVTRGGKDIPLTHTEFALLEFLLRNRNTILTRRRIAEQVWGYTFDTGTNIVDVYISYLRDAIDDGFEKKLILTVRGQGIILKDD